MCAAGQRSIRKGISGASGDGGMPEPSRTGGQTSCRGSLRRREGHLQAQREDSPAAAADLALRWGFMSWLRPEILLVGISLCPVSCWGSWTPKRSVSRGVPPTWGADLGQPREDEQEEDEEGAGLRVGEQVKPARGGRARRAGREGGRRAGNLVSLTDSPVGSQLGNTFPSLRAGALGCSRSC